MSSLDAPAVVIIVGCAQIQPAEALPVQVRQTETRLGFGERGVNQQLGVEEPGVLHGNVTPSD